MDESGNQGNTLYKLMLLYMLRKMKYAMSLNRISDFFLGKGYTSWFILQNALGELTESELVHVDTIRNKSYYAITPEGENTIGFFSGRIPASIREDMDSYIQENRLRVVNESSAQADYYRSPGGEYCAHCTIKEKNASILDLTLTVPSEAQAQAICRNWEANSQEVYVELMQALMHKAQS